MKNKLIRMKLKNKIWLTGLMLLFIVPAFSQNLYTDETPEHVILNLTENPSTSVAVTWRTISDIEQNIEWLNITDSPAVSSEEQKMKAQKETVTYLDGDTPPITVTNHSAVLTNLKPSTSYLYRVGNGSKWSEWYEFKTAGKDSDPFTFIYMGDAQNSLKAHWSRVIRKAYLMAPDAGFIFHAGDLINRTNNELEWQEWFHAGSFIHASLPSMMTPGNHEYDDLVLDNHWRPQFTLPDNGPDHKLLKETTYYVDYQDLRMISVDADMLDESEEAVTKTMEWLEKTLSENDKNWTILALHYPFYSTKSNRDNPELRQAFQPIVEKYKIDMVLTGHDHAYGRGMENIQSMTREGEISGPVYVVSVSGPKMYDLSDKGWMTRKAGNTQLFQIISIDGKKLNFKAFTASGTLYDEFDLTKRKGKMNKLVNRIPDVPENLYSR